MCYDDYSFDFCILFKIHIIALRGTLDKEPSGSVDKLSVCVCLIGCLGGILTEFQLEFV